MSETTNLSIHFTSEVKDALVKFCKRRGIKLRYLIEQAIIEQLEDEIDLEAFRQRRGEETISLEKLLSKKSKGKRC